MAVNINTYDGFSFMEFCNVAQDLKESWFMLMNIYSKPETPVEELRFVLGLMKSGIKKEFMEREDAIKFINSSGVFIKNHYVRLLLDSVNKRGVLKGKKINITSPWK